MAGPESGMRLVPALPPDVDLRLTRVKLKSTPARVRVFEVLAGHDHLSPEQIHLLAERGLPGLSLSTVYRTLDTLVEVGLVGHTHISGVARSYHLAEHRGHTHLTCRDCGAAFVVPTTVTTEFARTLSATYSFHLDVDHLVLTGQCTDCADGTHAS